MNTIVGLSIYPVKSMRGISLESVQLDECGFQYDRRWMMTDSEGQCLTQRDIAEMSLMHTSIHNGILHLRNSQGQTIHVDPSQTPTLRRVVSIWDDQCDVLDEGLEAASFLSDSFHRSCHLVRMPDAPTRRLDIRYSAAQDAITFFDSQPIHLITTSSLSHLSASCGFDIPVDRFRPNIVVQTADAYVEDTWQNVRISDVDFVQTKATSRCVVTTIDQQTGKAGKEPLQTLSKIRRQNNKTLFGIYLLHKQKHGHLKLGDAVLSR